MPPQKAKTTTVVQGRFALQVWRKVVSQGWGVRKKWHLECKPSV